MKQMKNENRIYTGNIMVRTYVEDEVIGPNKVDGHITCSKIKENAYLYKTTNGGYVDLEDVLKKSDYRKVDKVEIGDSSVFSKNGITIMPAVALSKAEESTKSHGSDGTLGLFVDLESLQLCDLNANIKLNSGRNR